MTSSFLRLWLAAGSLVILLGVACLHQVLSGTDVAIARLLAWGALAIGIYVLLARSVGYYPPRYRLPQRFRYIERWDFRAAAAALPTLVVISVGAAAVDSSNFIGAFFGAVLALFIFECACHFSGAYKDNNAL